MTFFPTVTRKIFQHIYKWKKHLLALMPNFTFTYIYIYTHTHISWQENIFTKTVWLHKSKNLDSPYKSHSREGGNRRSAWWMFYHTLLASVLWSLTELKIVFLSAKIIDQRNNLGSKVVHFSNMLIIPSRSPVNIHTFLRFYMCNIMVIQFNSASLSFTKPLVGIAEDLLYFLYIVYVLVFID